MLCSRVAGPQNTVAVKLPFYCKYSVNLKLADMLKVGSPDQTILCLVMADTGLKPSIVLYDFSPVSAVTKHSIVKSSIYRD